MAERIYSRDIVLLLAASFFAMGSCMMVVPLIAGFSEDVGAAAAVMGVIVGVMNIVSLLCRPFVGNLTDAISKYTLACGGIILMIVATAGYMVAGNVPVIFAARIINGLGFACCTVCMSTWLADLLPKGNIGSGMGLYGLMNALAMAVSPAVGLLVYQSLGYRAAFGVSCGFAVMTLLLIQGIQNRDQPVPKGKGGPSSLRLVDWHVLPIALLVMLFAIPYCATSAFLVSYVEGRQLSVDVSLYFPLYAGSLFILRLTLKSLFDRVSLGTFLIASSLSVVVGMAALTGLWNNWFLLLGAVGMAGGYGLIYSVCQAAAIKRADAGHRGLANSTFYVGLDLGMAVGPFIGGILYGHVPLLWFYPALFGTLPLIAVVYGLDRYVLAKSR